VRWIRFWRYAVREPRETFAELNRKTNESLLPDKNNNNNQKIGQNLLLLLHVLKRRKNLVSTLEESGRRRRRRHRSFLPLDSLLLHQCSKVYPLPTTHCLQLQLRRVLRESQTKYLKKKLRAGKKKRKRFFLEIIWHEKMNPITNPIASKYQHGIPPREEILTTLMELSILLFPN
jgi:hypothetical protein